MATTTTFISTAGGGNVLCKFSQIIIIRHVQIQTERYQKEFVWCECTKKYMVEMLPNACWIFPTLNNRTCEKVGEIYFLLLIGHKTLGGWIPFK